MIQDIDKLRKQMLRVMKETADLRGQLKEEKEERKEEHRQLLLSIIAQLDQLGTEEQKILEKSKDKTETETLRAHYAQVKKPLLAILQKYNIKPIAAPFNRLADFSVVEQTIKNKELADDTVVAILRDGYLVGDQLFRPTGLCQVKNS